MSGQSHTVLLMYCHSPLPTHTHTNTHSHKLHHQAVIAFSYIFYAYQSLVLHMPITPYLSLDFCQSITFPLSAFIILSLLPKNSMAGQSLSLQRPI